MHMGTQPTQTQTAHSMHTDGFLPGPSPSASPSGLRPDLLGRGLPRFLDTTHRAPAEAAATWQRL